MQSVDDGSSHYGNVDGGDVYDAGVNGGDNKSNVGCHDGGDVSSHVGDGDVSHGGPCGAYDTQYTTFN